PSYANGLNFFLHLGFSKRGERNSGQTVGSFEEAVNAMLLDYQQGRKLGYGAFLLSHDIHEYSARRSARASMPGLRCKRKAG
ncbi:MAG: hypothetical protein DMF53_13780, partial [Acidobacteria bacterium]